MAIVPAKGYSMLAALPDLLFFFLFIPLPNFLYGANVAPPSRSLLARGDSESFVARSRILSYRLSSVSLSLLRFYSTRFVLLARARVPWNALLSIRRYFFVRWTSTTCSSSASFRRTVPNESWNPARIVRSL